jgi:hypothetical protein
MLEQDESEGRMVGRELKLAFLVTEHPQIDDTSTDGPDRSPLHWTVAVPGSHEANPGPNRRSAGSGTRAERP